MNIFVDAGPLRALVAPSDQWRKPAEKIAKKLTSSAIHLITTDYVVNEVFTGLLADAKGGNYRIKEFDLRFLQRPILTIEWITKERFFQVKKLFIRVSKDKSWSFTDCSSYVMMKEMKITTVFTFDEHFEQMGFTLLS